MSEPWLCGNCSHTGPLSVRGRCEVCGSEGVMPAMVLRSEAEVNAPKKKRKYTRRATKKDVQELERILSL